MSTHAPSRFLTRRPLAGFSLVFASGCVWGCRAGLYLPLFAVLGALGLLGALFFRKGRVGLFLFYLAVGCAAVLHAGLFRQVWLDSLSFSSPVQVVFRGKVSGDPVWFEKDGRPQTSVMVRGRFEPGGSAQVRVVCSANSEVAFRHGEVWRFHGRFYPYRHRAKYAGALYLKSAVEGAVLEREAPLFFRFCQKLRASGRARLGRGLSDYPQTAGLLRAMLLGCREGVRGELRRNFAASGTLHLFALSGLHVGIVALLLVALLKLLGVGRPCWGLVLIPLLWVYVVTAGMRPSTLRAFVMAAVYWGSPLFRRRADALLALALAILIVLFVNPLQVLDPGFVLSFSVVGVMVAVCGRFRDWLVPEDYELGGWTWRHRFGFYVRSLVLSSTVAWSASFPLALFYFGKASVVGPLANLLAVPLSFLIVLTGGLSLSAGSVSPLAAEGFNHANRLFLAGLCGVADFFGEWPLACVKVAALSGWRVGLWYLGLALLIGGKQKSRRLLGAGLLLLFAGGFFG